MLGAIHSVRNARGGEEWVKISKYLYEKELRLGGGGKKTRKTAYSPSPTHLVLLQYLNFFANYNLFFIYETDGVTQNSFHILDVVFRKIK